MAKEKPKSKYSRLSPSQWEQVVVLWELGKATYRELSQMFGISEENIRVGLKKRGAVKGSRAAEIGEAVVEASKDDIQKKLEEINRFKRRYIGFGDVISTLTIKEITEAVKAGVPLSTRKENLLALNKAASTLATLRSEGYHLHGLNDENQITEDFEIDLPFGDDDEVE